MFLQLPGHFNLHLQEMTSQEFSAPSSHVILANGRVPFTQTDRQRQVVWPLARAQSHSHASGHKQFLSDLCRYWPPCTQAPPLLAFHWFAVQALEEATPFDAHLPWSSIAPTL